MLNSLPFYRRFSPSMSLFYHNSLKVNNRGRINLYVGLLLNLAEIYIFVNSRGIFLAKIMRRGKILQFDAYSPKNGRLEGFWLKMREESRGRTLVTSIG